MAGSWGLPLGSNLFRSFRTQAGAAFATGNHINQDDTFIFTLVLCLLGDAF